MTIGQLRVLTASPNHEKFVRLLSALGNAGFEVSVEAENQRCPSIVVLAGEKPGLPMNKVEALVASCKSEDGVLAVLIEKTEIPKALKKTRFFDLSRWRGSEKNAVFVALITALNTGNFEPPQISVRSSVGRAVKRWSAGLTATAVLGAIIFFGFNILSLQNNVCSINFAQPQISDLCGRFGLGGKPTRLERLAWEDLPRRDCDALRRHIEAFQDGAFRDDAADLLTASRTIEEELWTPAARQLSLFVGQDGDSVADQERAQAFALERGQSKAERLCSGFASTTLYRLVSAKPIAETWDCRNYASGSVCGFDGKAVCEVEVRQIFEREVCGSSDD